VVVNIDNANDYSVKIGDIRVSIPFFVLSKIDENLGRLERDGKISDKGSIIDHSMKSGQSPYLWRGAIYKGIL
ncbi:MAG: hypothetical protein MJZ16_02880, partial [Bacteroidales bacterium]|nr:hypothetical protein [Bacteroidales bacterium]